jgi:UDPglucose 6-dehydrogenase
MGLGKLGLPMAALYSRAGHDVVGYDVDAHLVDRIRKGECPHEEPGLAELLAHNAFTVTQEVEDLASCGFVFIVVPTPSLVNGSFDSTAVVDAVQALGGVTESNQTVVIVSTVMPGTMDRQVAPVAERFHLSTKYVYSPEFIALGSVIADMENPQFILAGGYPSAAQSAADLMLSIVKEPVPVHLLGFREAEIAKLAINTFLTLKISFANTIGKLCEHPLDRLAQPDARKILEVVGSDNRVGQRYLKSGTAFGGPCLPRDCVAFEAWAWQQGHMEPLSHAVQEVNRQESARILKAIRELVSENCNTVGVLGMSYKDGTTVTTGSIGVELSHRLVTESIKVLTYDPLIPAMCSGTAQEVVDGCDVVVLATDSPAWQKLRLSDASVVDCFGVLSQRKKVRKLFRLGVGRVR